MAPSEFLTTHYEMQTVRGEEGLLDDEALARETGLRLEMVQRLYYLGVLAPVVERQGKPLYSDVMIFRLRRVLRLRRDLGLSWHSLGLVADLLERIEQLEEQVRQLEHQTQDTE